MENDDARQPSTMEQPTTGMDQPRREFHYYEEEYSAAVAIVGMLTKRVEANPKLNLCIVRRFCEIMTNNY